VPALPWTSIRRPDPDRSHVGFATKLPLTAYRHIPAAVAAEGHRGLGVDATEPYERAVDALFPGGPPVA
jgi:hypothetical protein